ncbi:MAG: hypothetical protein AVDCRST_MAG18-3435, partial [uncultured Thermomicrobiales bacterium]
CLATRAPRMWPCAAIWSWDRPARDGRRAAVRSDR